MISVQYINWYQSQTHDLDYQKRSLSLVILIFLVTRDGGVGCSNIVIVNNFCAAWPNFHGDFS